MSSSIVNKRRKHFGIAADQGPSVPYLIKAQIDSYEQLLQKGILPNDREDIGIQEVFKANFPILSQNGNAVVRFLGYHIESPTNSPLECKNIGCTYSGSMRLSLEMIIQEDGSEYVKQQEIYIGDVPFMTENATFIINGSERIIVSQLHRSPGLFFEMVQTDTAKTYSARIIPTKGAWLDLEIDEKNQIFALINKKKIYATTFLMGLADDDPLVSDKEKVLSLFYNDLHLVKEGDFYNLIIEDSQIESMKGKRLQFDLLESDKTTVFCYSDNILGKLKAGKKYYVTAESLTKFELYSEIVFDEKVIAEPCDAINMKLLEILPDGYSLRVIDKDTQFGRQIINSLKNGKCSAKIDATMKIYSAVRPNEPVKASATRGIVEATFMNESRYNLTSTGRMKINRKLGLETEIHTLTQEDIVLTTMKLLLIANGHEQADDPDSLEFRRVRSVGELIKNQFQQSISKLARAIQDRVSSVTKETSILELINARHFNSTIREFFSTSQLSQLADQTNLLSELSHKRRLSSFGPGGLDRARPWLEVRDLHPTHYGKICAIETPEGTAIGLVNSLAIYAQIDDHGFIKTPYRKVKDGVILDEIVYLTAVQEVDQTIAHYEKSIFSEDGSSIKPGFIHCRRNNDHALADYMEVNYVDISPKQILSISSSLIPFVENDDATRAVLGANMQRQALPLINPSAPLVGTGMEKIVVRDSGTCIKARRPGVVEYVSANKIIIRSDDPTHIFDKYDLIKLSKSNDSTMINQSPCVSVGDSVKEGDFIALGTGIDKGEIALGRNVRIAFLSWKGGNHEDAIIISSRMAKQFSSIGLTKFEISTREIKQGIEQFTRDIPNINAEFINQLDESGIINIGTQVKAGDILVGRVTPKGETNLSPDERLLRAIFGDKSIDVKDSSLRVPPGMHGTVVDVRVFTRKGIDKNRRTLEINQANMKKYAAERDLELGMLDKSFIMMAKNLLSGSKKFNAEDVVNWRVKDFLEAKGDSKQYKACVNSYNTAKNKIDAEYTEKCKKLIEGDSLPAGVLETVQVFIATEYTIQTGDKIAGRHGNKGIISKVMAPENMPYTKDGEIIDMLFTSVGISGRMNIGQVLETHLGWASVNLAKQITDFVDKAEKEKVYLEQLRNLLNEIYDGQREREMLNSMSDEDMINFAKELENGIPFACPVFEGPSRQKIRSLLELAGCDPSGKEELWDGETGEKFPQKVSVGVMYVMQLHHLVERKEHARSVGPYSIITQQPLGGRAQQGGQRFGEMEVWALQAYAAAYTARETLTVKSDYPIGRSRIFELISQGYDLFDKGGVPESFAVLLYELRALCLNVDCMIFKDGQFIPQELIGIENFDALKISIASPAQIRSWSYGEVLKPETIHYRTSRPHPEGIFSTKIFGPIKDYQCLCGKHKGTKRKGIICSKCGTEVTTSKVRRYRMGHIELASPVAHIWFTKVLPSRIAIILDMTMLNLNKLLKFEHYAVISPGLSPYSVGQILTEQEHREAVNNYEDNGFEAYTGTEAIEVLLKNIKLEKEIQDIRSRILTAKEGQKIKMIRRLKLLEAFHKNGTKPEYMILRVIPVLPPDLRPLVAIEGGRFASSDFNDLYRRIINRNNRLQKLLKYSTPSIIIRNEKRMLQEAVDGLFDNSRRSQPITSNTNKRPLKSLADTIKGKQGRFRQNLLGKRVDYSGRSVIVVGPHLKLYQCGLPKSMALELFKPFVLARLVLRGFAPTLRIAKTLIENKQSEVWDILSEVTKNYVVLINRAPTLHRLGIQAFEPVLIEGRAIQLHPLTCKAFNADFDGDQVGVHVPLSIESQIEARLLMMSTKCILNPSNGIPIAIPAKDMVLGLYAMTCIERGFGNEEIVVSHLDEAEHALSQGIIRYTTPIKLLMNDKIIDTTYGRMKLYSAVPKHPDLTFDLVNCAMSSKEVQDLVYSVYVKAGEEAAAKFLDKIMGFGFYHATMCGATFSYSDLPVPEEKQQLITDTNKMIADYQRQYMNGLIREDERHNKLTSAWSKCADTIASKLMEKLAEEKSGQMMNPVWMIAVSGARGSALQLRQLAGMRGLLARSDGSVQESPIVNSFIEGMNVREYILAAQGARKGLSDTALKTANSGYLTRRLADTAQDCITQIEDCGTNKYLELRSLSKSGNTILSLATRAFGRTLAEDLVDHSGNILAHSGEIVDINLKAKIEELELISIKIRSPVTCEYNGSGICCKCYGYDLSSLKPVKKHVSVGIIAAQSIGEPGTQLTMKSFHTGGAAQNILSDSRITAISSGTIRLNNIKSAEFQDNQVVISRNNIIELLDSKGRVISHHRIPYGAHINVQDNQEIKKGDVIASWDPYILPMIAEKKGRLSFKDLVKDVSYKEVFDYNTGLVKCIVKSSTQRYLPCLVLETEDGQRIEYFVEVNDSIEVENGSEVMAGQTLVQRAQNLVKTQDIVGGLPLIGDMFEARIPKNSCIMSEIAGTVEVLRGNQQKVIIHGDNARKEYSIARNVNIVVDSGDEVQVGDYLTDGRLSMHDVLNLKGSEEMALSFIDDIQGVYQMQGIFIADKHVEIILCQMLSCGLIVDPGQTALLRDDVIRVDRITKINEALVKMGKPLVEYKPVLNGISKAAISQKNHFFAAASFQGTIQRLTEAVILNEIDPLNGMKAALITGQFIPAGVGGLMHEIQTEKREFIEATVLEEAIREQIV